MIELLLQAERALSMGLVDQAERLYLQAATADPRNSIAVVGLARVALERGDDILAWREAKRALRIDPENAAAQRMVERFEEVWRYRGTPLPGGSPITAGAAAAPVAPGAPVPPVAPVASSAGAAPGDSPRVAERSVDGSVTEPSAGTSAAVPPDEPAEAAEQAEVAAAVPAETPAAAPAAVVDAPVVVDTPAVVEPPMAWDAPEPDPAQRPEEPAGTVDGSVTEPSVPDATEAWARITAQASAPAVDWPAVDLVAADLVPTRPQDETGDGPGDQPDNETGGEAGHEPGTEPAGEWPPAEQEPPSITTFPGLGRVRSLFVRKRDSGDRE